MSGIQTKSNAGLSAKEAFDQSVNIGWVCCQHRGLTLWIDFVRAAPKQSVRAVAIAIVSDGLFDPYAIRVGALKVPSSRKS